MRVKRYVAESIPEAIARVKSDLGRNAIILHTKPFKEGGFFGLFCKRRFEVIAAIDENPSDIEPTRSDKKIEAKKPDMEAGIPNPSYTSHTAESSNSTFTPYAAPKIQPDQTTATYQTQPETSAAAEPELAQLKEELAEVKELIKQVVGNSAEKAALPRAVPAESAPGPLLDAPQTNAGFPGLTVLKPYDLAEDLLDYLIRNVSNRADLQPGNHEAFLEFCRQLISKSLPCDEPFRRTPAGKPLIVALVGPTGVGKTTTIAKLAANFNLFEGKKVGLLTIDTYRIAAVEHLKTYGEIINLPVEVIYTLADMDRSLENFQNYDLILIDTAGRSPHNQAMMAELRQFLSHPAIDMIQLVISATTQYRDMVGIADHFAVIPYTHIIFTKLDETSCLGPVVSLAWRAQKPISYVTTGQNVPDDIEVAKAEKLADRLFKGLNHG